MTQRPIVVLCAMDSEYKSLAARLKNATVQTVGNLHITSGTVRCYPVTVVRTLIGTVNVTTAATYFIATQKPVCVILQGTAGAHNPELSQGDIVLGKENVEFNSCFVPHRDEGQGVDPFAWRHVGVQVLEDGKATRMQRFASDPHLLSVAKKTPYAHGRVFEGAVLSADVWNREIDRIHYIRNTFHTDCEEMEGAAVGQVCRHFSVPFLNIRVISNSELHEGETFDPKTAEYGQEFCYDVVSRLVENGCFATEKN